MDSMSVSVNRPAPVAAHTNPWYVLMTLRGDNHDDNRSVWNAWIGQVLSDDEKEAAAAHARIPLEELSAWSMIGEAVEEAYVTAWSALNPGDPVRPIPDPRSDANFDQTVFTKECPFNAEGMVFNRSSFECCLFQTVPIFIRANFCRDVSFDGVEFWAGAHFESTMFQSDVSFSKAKFLKSARFTGTQFGGTRSFVDFEEAEFGRPIDQAPRSDGTARDERQVGTSDFTRAAFNSFTTFEGARFHHNLELKQTVFNSFVSFGLTNFSREARFEETTFKEDTDFSEATFFGTTEFVRSRFVGYAGFEEARFARGCQFIDGTFDGSTHFTNARFEADAAFTSLVCNGRVGFEEAWFGKTDHAATCQADFSDSTFNSPVSFRDAHFTAHYPILAGTLLHERSFFSNTPRLWPKVSALRGELSRGTVALKQANESCSVIRTLPREPRVAGSSPLLLSTGNALCHAGRPLAPEGSILPLLAPFRLRSLHRAPKPRTARLVHAVLARLGIGSLYVRRCVSRTVEACAAQHRWFLRFGKAVLP